MPTHNRKNRKPLCKALLGAFSIFLFLVPLVSLIASPLVATFVSISSKVVGNTSIYYTSTTVANTNPPKKIILQHADSLIFDKQLMPGINKLVGHVELLHDRWIMTCDSAYFNEEENSFEAFSRVTIHDDSIDIHSKHLYYDGTDRIAQLRNSVELSNSTATLYTDKLDYDRNEGKGYYFEGGTIVDSLNTLSSVYGEYIPAEDEAYFEDEVVLENPDFTLYTERLRYNTQTKIAYFDGPTRIVSDSGHIESTRGIYDTSNDVAILLDKSVVYNKQGTLVGDSILYDKQRKFAEVFGNMVLNDTVNKDILMGNYGYFVEDKEYAFATSYAWLKDYSREDTLYLGADTLEMISKKNDSFPNNSNPIRLILAYHKTKLFQNKMRGVADSMAYFSHDSILSLYQSPIVWSDSTQLEGDTIRTFFAGDTVHHATSWFNAKAMRQLNDSTLYEQVKGDSLLAFFANESVREIQAYRNVEMIYFLLQEAINHYFGVARMNAPTAYVYLASDTLQKALALGPVDGTVTPIEKATESDKTLEGFTWKYHLSPQNPQAVIATLLDSLGNPIPFSPIPLSDLSRFDGSIAALVAYRTIDSEIKLSQQRKVERNEQKQQQQQQQQQALPIYIRRAKQTDPPYEYLNGDITTLLNTKKWLFSETLINPDSSTTNPSITIPERLP